jgi:predicted esterase YcpF (UPF0227 family)
MPFQPASSHLLYLHGFRSSPQSCKARLMAAWIERNKPDVVWWCPQLPPSPRTAIAMLQQGIANWPLDRMAVVGSSLGGFYASWIAEQTGCRAVLLNPAVNPARDLLRYIGDQTSWHDPSEHFFFRAEFVDELQALTLPVLTRPERYLAVIAKGDELLDWREMLARCEGARIHLLEGSNHALSDFELQLPTVMGFLGLD